MKEKHRNDKNIGTINISRTSGGSSNRFVGSVECILCGKEIELGEVEYD